MPRTAVVVVGAGQAGLAVSHCLTEVDVEHVVLERGRLAERWRTERWDSLRLLTPNWATRLPGWHYTGPDPGGYMTADELVSYFEGYARSFAAPVRHGEPVRSLDAAPSGFTVRTANDTWHADDVVIATGWSDQPRVPALANSLDGGIVQLTTRSYRNPAQISDGGVLVVGASASGVQLADEVARTGRDVVIAVGRHARAPRRYRGVDIWTWLDRIGSLAETVDGAADPAGAPHRPSLQLVGGEDGRDVDLPSLQQLGVRLAGRLVDVRRSSVSFAGDLRTSTNVAQAQVERLLRRIDAYVDQHDLVERLPPPESLRTVSTRSEVGQLDLRRGNIATVIWATGYQRPYEWLRVPVRDASGEIVQSRGVTPYPGLYVVGQRFQHRRDSNFIDGVRHDAAFVVQHLTARHGRHVAA